VSDEQRREAGCPARELCCESRGRDTSADLQIRRAEIESAPKVRIRLLTTWRQMFEEAARDERLAAGLLRARF
jgi:hypothetical protein